MSSALGSLHSEKALPSYFDELRSAVERSAANNTKLYDYLERSASLKEITHFLRWDAEEPHYYTFLQMWEPKCPESVKPYLVEHIDIEKNEQHSKHFQDMLAYLNSQVTDTTQIDRERLKVLNYPLSEECYKEQNFGYFLGFFYTTELMHAKRAGQLLHALRKLGIGDENLEYLIIHADADDNHSEEILHEMVEPLVSQNKEILFSIKQGIEDRLTRSANYLEWYYSNQLKK